MKRYDHAKCGKYYRCMFLMIIPSLVVGLILNYQVTAKYPALATVGQILKLIISLVHAYFIYKLASEDERYKKAAFLSAGTAVITLVNNLLPAGSLALKVILSLVCLALGVFYAMNFYSATADVLSEPDPVLSAKWLQIKKLYLILAAVTCGSMTLVFIPLLALLFVLAAAIMAIVVYIMELIALNKSSKVCALYAEAVSRPEDEAPVN